MVNKCHYSSEGGNFTYRYVETFPLFFMLLYKKLLNRSFPTVLKNGWF